MVCSQAGCQPLRPRHRTMRAPEAAIQETALAWYGGGRICREVMLKPSLRQGQGPNRSLQPFPIKGLVKRRSQWDVRVVRMPGGEFLAGRDPCYHRRCHAVPEKMPGMCGTRGLGARAPRCSPWASPHRVSAGSEGKHPVWLCGGAWEQQRPSWEIKSL